MTDTNDRPIRDDSVAAVPPPERPSMTPPPQYVPPEAPIGRAYRPVTVAGPAPLALRRDLVRWGPVVAGLVTALTSASSSAASSRPARPRSAVAARAPSTASLSGRSASSSSSRSPRWG